MEVGGDAWPSKAIYVYELKLKYIIQFEGNSYLGSDPALGGYCVTVEVLYNKLSETNLSNAAKSSGREGVQGIDRRWFDFGDYPSACSNTGS